MLQNISNENRLSNFSNFYNNKYNFVHKIDTKCPLTFSVLERCNRKLASIKIENFEYVRAALTYYLRILHASINICCKWILLNIQLLCCKSQYIDQTVRRQLLFSYSTFNFFLAKGQLILKCPFCVFKSSNLQNNQQNFFQDFCPSLQKGVKSKILGHFIPLIGGFFFTSFLRQCRNLGKKNRRFFLENLKTPKGHFEIN